jgi:hypothetical protein
MDWIGTEKENFWGTLFRDVLMATIGVLILSLVILIFHIAKDDTVAEEARDRGNVRVEILWPNEMNVDIDLWVQAPGDVPVGYSNLNGQVFNLVRDDLGHYNDLTSMNYEVAHSRGIPDYGEWIINLHWFSNRSNETSVPVTVIITIKKDDSANSKGKPVKILNTTVTLIRVGQEKTVVRFRIDADGNIEKSSISRLNKPIRAITTSDEHP